jgi:hypothetical protein
MKCAMNLFMFEVSELLLYELYCVTLIQLEILDIIRQRNDTD